MTARRKPTAATWRTLAGAARRDRENQNLTRVTLGARAEAHKGSVERLERPVIPQSNELTGAYRRTLKALGWPDGWAEAILAGTKSGPPVISDEPSGTLLKNHATDPKVEKLLLHFLRGDAARMIAEEATTADLVNLRVLVDEALAERALIEVQEARPDRRRGRSAPPAPSGRRRATNARTGRSSS